MDILSSTGGRAPWRFGLTGVGPILAHEDAVYALNAL
jgi:hypothetical protein